MIRNGLALVTQQSTKESLGRRLVAVRLQQNIDDIPVLIDGTPKILHSLLSYGRLYQPPRVICTQNATA
jgi:hypothetical protein